MNKSKSHISRRTVLRAAGVSLALPMLESVPALAAPASNGGKAKRLFCIGANLGYYRPAFYPKQTGTRYQLSEHLKHLADFRRDFTVFSGLDHRAANNHNNWDNYLCGPKIGSVSLDQIAAEQLGTQTRIPSLQLCAGGVSAIQKMCYTREGVPLPMTARPSVLYKKLFSSPEDRKRTHYLLRTGRSALDTVLNDARKLERSVSASDKQKLNEYFNSLREVERRMTRQLEHLKKPSAVKVDYTLPPYDPIAPTLMVEAEQLMYDLTAIAFQTDATRVGAMFLSGGGQVFTIDDTTLRAGYHALSHHGNDPQMIRDLIKVEGEHLKCLSRFLGQLKSKTDADGKPLLDTTIVLFGTGMGDANRHANDDLPTLVAGGGFQHGKHIRTNPKAPHAHLLGDLYLTLLEQLGIEDAAFGNAKRTMEI